MDVLDFLWLPIDLIKNKNIYIFGNFHGVAEGGAFNDVGSVFRVTGCLF